MIISLIISILLQYGQQEETALKLIGDELEVYLDILDAFYAKLRDYATNIQGNVQQIKDMLEGKNK